MKLLSFSFTHPGLQSTKAFQHVIVQGSYKLVRLLMAVFKCSAHLRIDMAPVERSEIFSLEQTNLYLKVWLQAYAQFALWFVFFWKPGLPPDCHYFARRIQSLTGNVCNYFLTTNPLKKKTLNVLVRKMTGSCTEKCVIMID